MIRQPYIIWLAICVHLLWAGLLSYSDDALGVTAINYFFGWLSHRAYLAGLYATVAGLAIYSLLWPGARIGAVAAILPQQFVLMCSALSACIAVADSAYADGVIRPRAFISADQLPGVFMAVLHTAAIWDIHIGPVWRLMKRKGHG